MLGRHHMWNWPNILQEPNLTQKVNLLGLESFHVYKPFYILIHFSYGTTHICTFLNNLPLMCVFTELPLKPKFLVAGTSKHHTPNGSQLEHGNESKPCESTNAPPSAPAGTPTLHDKQHGNCRVWFTWPIRTIGSNTTCWGDIICKTGPIHFRSPTWPKI